MFFSLLPLGGSQKTPLPPGPAPNDTFELIVAHEWKSLRTPGKESAKENHDL